MYVTPRDGRWFAAATSASTSVAGESARTRSGTPCTTAGLSLDGTSLAGGACKARVKLSNYEFQLGRAAPPTNSPRKTLNWSEYLYLFGVPAPVSLVNRVKTVVYEHYLDMRRLRTFPGPIITETLATGPIGSVQFNCR